MVARMSIRTRLSVTAMRLDRFLPFALAALVAACNPQAADRSGAARAPIPAAQAPAPEAASAACPETPAPACVTDKASAKPAWRGTRVAARHKPVVHKTVVHRAAAQPPRSAPRRYEALAGGPAPHSGYARVPHRDYARVPQDDYPNGPATTYRYGPAYPPAARSDERDYDRYVGDAYGPDERYRRREERRGPPPRDDHYDRGEHHGARRAPPPPPEDRYGARRSSREDEEALYNERYGVRRHEGMPQPPPVFDPPDGRVYEGRAYDGRASERRSYEGRYESRSESRSTYESRSVRRDDGPCCRTEAAGFDANGFLTWPGKVPARP